ncbi:MAG: DoxX family protein [Actinomycetes bacterium]|jgi:uncharacterized membrane protein YphA (DoxX/SURF4 family)
MHLTHNILVALLALIFLISGLSKASGSPKGLSGTRELDVKDIFARAVGVLEATAALLLIYGLRYPDSFIAWGALVFLWCVMGGAIYTHSKRSKMSISFPPFFLLTLISVVLVIS